MVIGHNKPNQAFFSNIPTMQFATGNPRHTQSKSICFI